MRVRNPNWRHTLQSNSLHLDPIYCKVFKQIDVIKRFHNTN